MRLRPMNRSMLTHSIKWIKRRLSSDENDISYIDNVLIVPGYVVDQNGSQQSGYANYKLYYDCNYSTKMKDGSIPTFSVGDSIKIEKGPINGYPTLLKIINVWQMPDSDGKHVHHIEVLMR